MKFIATNFKITNKKRRNKVKYSIQMIKYIYSLFCYYLLKLRYKLKCHKILLDILQIFEGIWQKVSKYWTNEVMTNKLHEEDEINCYFLLFCI